jgi:hypothetical protein
VAAPNLKPSPRNREVLTGAVYAQTYLQGGRLWGIDHYGNLVESPLGFLVDPNTGRLIYRGWDEKRATDDSDHRGGTMGSAPAVKWQRFAFRKPCHWFIARW